MKNYLRYAFIAVLAFICNVSFAQTVVTFTAETDKGSFDATQTGTGAGADKITKAGVTIQTSNGAFAATDYNTKAAQYRIYKSATFTVSSTVGNITKVVITCTTMVMQNMVLVASLVTITKPVQEKRVLGLVMRPN